MVTLPIVLTLVGLIVDWTLAAFRHSMHDNSLLSLGLSLNESDIIES